MATLPMPERPRRGSCFCGAVTFIVRNEPRWACHCHCESCRKASGAAFVTWVTFARGDFHVTSGEIAWHHSSTGVTRGHCPVCGTSLTYEHVERADEIDVTLASLDDSTGINPERHIWTQDQAPWFTFDDELPTFDTTGSGARED